MAQSFTSKHGNYVLRLSAALVSFMADTDLLTALTNESTLDGYGSGGANPLTDTDVQNVLPAATAAAVNYAVGQLANSNAILSQIAAARAAFEALRP